MATTSRTLQCPSTPPYAGSPERCRVWSLYQLRDCRKVNDAAETAATGPPSPMPVTAIVFGLPAALSAIAIRNRHGTMRCNVHEHRRLRRTRGSEALVGERALIGNPRGWVAVSG